MAGALASTVYVVDEAGETHTFGPGDRVPGWAAELISNPKAWSVPPTAPAKAADPADPPGGEGEEPPRGGAGSGRDTWAAYAASLGVEVTEDMVRDDIVAAVDEAQA